MRTRVVINSAQIMLQAPAAVDLGIASVEVSALVLYILLHKLLYYNTIQYNTIQYSFNIVLSIYQSLVLKF